MIVITVSVRIQLVIFKHCMYVMVLKSRTHCIEKENR